MINCPDCNHSLEEVLNDSNGMLNEDQFDAVRAGDWFCKNCTGVRGRSGYRYFWNSELFSRNLK